jgi:hypothetical protein
MFFFNHAAPPWAGFDLADEPVRVGFPAVVRREGRVDGQPGIGAEDRRDRPSLSSHIPDISSPFAWISRSRRGTPHAARICLPPRPAVGESALPPICSVAADGLPITVGVKEWQICAAVRTHT